MKLHYSITNKRSVEVFKTLEQRFQKKHNYKYSYDKTVYKGARGTIIITCPVHEDFEQSSQSHLSGNGCPKCSVERHIKARRTSQKEFIEKATKVHKNFYTYTHTEYINSKHKIIITCPIHGDFTQRPDIHIKGAKCLLCSNQKRASQDICKAKESFIEKCKNIHGEIYKYSKVSYNGSRTPVKVICKEHGTFTIAPSSHLQGSGCPVCGEIRRIQALLTDENTLFRLYYVKVNNVWKIGVTSKPIHIRLSVENLQNVLYSSKPISLDRAVKIEQYIIKRYSKFASNEIVMLGGGSNECFDRDILNKFLLKEDNDT